MRVKPVLSRFIWRLSRLGRKRKLKRYLKDYPSLAYLLKPRECAFWPERKWWQFWKRKIKITAVGSGGQVRGRMLGVRPDMIIIDDMETGG